MLLIRPYPIDGESARGFLLRISELNGCEGPRWLCQEMERPDFATNGESHIAGLLNRGRDADLNKLRGPVANMGPLNEPDRGGLALRYWNTLRPRYCPICLSESLYWRAEWDLNFMVVCPQHHTFLVDVCGRCEKPLSWYRGKLHECNCGSDLRTLRPDAAGERCQLISAEISYRLRRESPQVAISEAVTKKLDLEAYLKLVWFLGAYGLNAQGKPQKIAGLQKLQVAIGLASVAERALESWPHGYWRLLTQIAGRAPENRGHTRLAAQFGFFYPTLYKTFSGKEFEFLRLAFEDHLHGNWSGQIAARNRRLSHDLRERFEWIPFSKAAKLAGMRAENLRAMVRGGDLKGHEYRTLSGRTSGVVQRDDLERLIDERKQCITLSGVRKLLGISRKRTEKLVAMGVLIPISVERRPGSPWTFSRAQVLSAAEEL